MTIEQWVHWFNERLAFEREVQSDDEVNLFEVITSIFGITTYDSEADEHFARIIIDVLRAICIGDPHSYHQVDKAHYLNYLMVCNMERVAPLLDWGTSIRGARLSVTKPWDLYGDLARPLGVNPVALTTTDEFTTFLFMLWSQIAEHDRDKAAAEPTKGVTVEVIADDHVFESTTGVDAEIIIEQASIDKRLVTKHAGPEYQIVPEGLHMDDQGTLFYYFSNFLDGKDQMPLQEWAFRITERGCDSDIGVGIIVDMPKMIQDLLGNGYGHENEVGGFTIDIEHKVAIEAVREQLIEAVVMFNRMQFE